MKIIDHTYPETSFEAFAEQHQLTIELRERPRHYGLPRYYAYFSRVEITDGRVLISAFGDGDSKEAAIADYATRLRGSRIVFGAYTTERREMQCPNEWAKKR